MEKDNIRQALTQYGYPEWAINKVKKEKEHPWTKKRKQNENQNKSKGLVVLPYVEGLNGKKSLQSFFKKHGYSTGMRPHQTLRNFLVHPKYKRNPLQTAEAI